jgi:hypothetical protein
MASVRMGRMGGAVALGLGLAGFVGGLPAADAADTAIVAAFGSSRTGQFATPVMAVQPGSKPTVVNLDIVWHGIESEESGVDDRPWCVAIDPSRPEDPVSNPRLKPLGECPLFWSDYAIVGGTAPVLGLEGVEAGKVYAYRCTVVPGMGGNLFVV